MKYASDTSSIFARYDINIEVARQQAQRASEDVLLQKVADCLIAGNEEELERTVKRALKERQPMDVILHGLMAGMKEVSRLCLSR